MTRNTTHTTRRTVVQATAGLATTALAGCSNVTGGLGGGPEYEDTVGNTMLSLSDFPEGWERNDEMNENFEAVFVGPDDGKFVMLSTDVKDDVQAAKDKLESMKNTNSETNELDIGDDAFWAKRDDHARVGVRDSNLILLSIAAYQSGMEWTPDQNRGIKYARKLLNKISDS
jgi:hypothetical protein